MRDDMPPRARSGQRLMARGHCTFWVLSMAVGTALLGGCLHSASKTADTGAPPAPESSSSTPASSTSTPAQSTSASGSTSPVPEFGTLPPPPPPPDAAPASGSVATSEGWITPAPASQTPGYRVQIFASSDRTKAESAAAEARQRFSEPVYIEFETPLYKVRVGDCATRHEADLLKEKAGTQGYDGAWVAESQVRGH